jgi:hypothetical protein
MINRILFKKSDPFTSILVYLWIGFLWFTKTLLKTCLCYLKAEKRFQFVFLVYKGLPIKKEISKAAGRKQGGSITNRIRISETR